MLKIGLAGAWHVHFEGYAKEVKSNENCVITSLWEENPELGINSAKKFDCKFIPDYDEFITSAELDAIVVSSATNLHPDILLKAANAGKHIFTEKVLCFTYEDALKIKEAVDRSGIKFCISFPWRGRGDFQWIKKALDEQLIGDVSYCRMRNAHNGASGGWLPPAFFDPVPCGGGAMMDLGAHPMYLLNWLMGEPKSVSSVFTNFMIKSVEDNAVSVIEYENGAIGVSETGFVAEKNPFSLELCGTKGTIFAGGHSDTLAYNIGDGWVTPEQPEALPSPIALWLNALLGGGEIPYTIDDAVALTRTMEAAYKSANENAKYYL